MIEEEESYREPPVLGYLKAGAASKGGIGKNQSHWRFVPKQRYKQAGVLFDEIYKASPNSINIYLAGHTVQECYDEWMLDFGKKSGAQGGYLKKKCTKKTIVQYLNPEPRKGEPAYLTTPIACQAPSCGCERHGTLRFYIVELFAAGYMFPVEFSTKSPNHRALIKNVLEDQERWLAMFDRSLHAARFLLEKVEERISVPQFKGSGKDAPIIPGVRENRQEWMVSLRPDPNWVADIMREAHARTLAGKSEMLVLSGDMQYATAAPQALLTPAAVEEMRQPEALEAEIVTEAEFKETNESDRININRLGSAARSLWADKNTWEKHLRTVLSMLYPHRHTSQLRDGHCDRVVNELLILWATQQKDFEGLEIFAGQEDARLFYQKEGPADGSDKAKRDKWVELVDRFKQPKT